MLRLSRIYAVRKVDVKRKGAEIAETRKGLATWRCVHHSVIRTLRFFAILCEFAFNLGVRFQLHRYGSARHCPLATADAASGARNFRVARAFVPKQIKTSP